MERAPVHGKPQQGINFEDLPTDVLFSIFQFLDLQSLSVLCSVSERLYNIINDEYLNVKSFSLLVTNQFSVEIQKKSLQILSAINKYRTNFHWKRKYYNERIFLKTKERYRPWLCLENNDLFISQGKEVLLYPRNERGIVAKPTVTFSGHSEDISRFVVKDGIMISGGNDGKICCWETKKGKQLFFVNNPIGWNESLYVDFAHKTLVSGFGFSGKVKFWLIKDDGFNFEKEIQLDERVWTVALNEDGSLCSVGSCGYNASPLKIYDLNRETYSLTIPEGYKVGAGVFDIIWETPQVLITGSYDTYVRMWDIRTGQCVKSWSDPYDAAIYSLATDYYWTIMAGTAVHGRVTLWDKRLSNCVQMYFMSKSMDSGPVYSVDFDPTYMFVALDSSLHILDFSSKTTRAKVPC